VSKAQIPAEIRQRIREEAGHRCGYCLSPQHLVLGVLEIEHIVPKACGGMDDESNLWLSCRLCNSFKAVQTKALDPITGRRVKLFHPRRQNWARHFRWNDDGTSVLGLTPCGRATVLALQLNNLFAVTVRREWVRAGWHPPTLVRVSRGRRKRT